MFRDGTIQLPMFVSFEAFCNPWRRVTRVKEREREREFFTLFSVRIDRDRQRVKHTDRQTNKHKVPLTKESNLKSPSTLHPSPSSNPLTPLPLPPPPPAFPSFFAARILASAAAVSAKPGLRFPSVATSSRSYVVTHDWVCGGIRNVATPGEEAGVGSNEEYRWWLIDR